jgi:hypothetical protein
MKGRMSDYPHGDVLVSPDGVSIAYADSKYSLDSHAVHVAPLTAWSKWTDYPHDLGLSTHFGMLRGHAAFEWSSDSRFLWTATQDHMRPTGGWATGPVRLFRADGGAVEKLPALNQDSELLDGVQWIGHSGKALALLGALGNYQSPIRDDRNPKIAMIDAKSGILLDARPLADFGSKLWRFGIIEGVDMPDGRIRAVVIADDVATVWTQGEAPIRLPGSFRDAGGIALTPDGQGLLVQYQLRVRDGCPQFRYLPPGKKIVCSPDPPAEGDRVALFTLPSGSKQWAIHGRREKPYMAHDPAPAISANGTYALVALVFDTRNAQMPRMALVSLRDGKILQTIPASGERIAMGFADASGAVWIHSDGLTQVYGHEWRGGSSR